MLDRVFVPTARSATCFFTLASVAALGWLIGPILDILLLAFGGLLMAVFLRSVGSWLARLLKINATTATATACALLLVAAAAATWLAAPAVEKQATELGRAVPKAIEEVGSWLEDRPWGDSVLQRLRGLRETAGEARTLTKAGGLLSTTFGAIASFVVLLFVGLYLAFAPQSYRRGFLHLVPPTKRERIRAVLDELESVLRQWIVGKMFAMFVVGLSTWLGLALLKVPLALVLALLAALLTFIPNFGPVISAVPAVLLGLVEGPIKALYIIALYVGVQTVESYLLTPIIQKRTISVPPALTILAQVLAATLAGGIGVLVATPLLAVVVVTVRMLYVEDVLGDRNGPSTS